MDVVRTNIEKIGGTIEVNTRSGLGTKFTIKIPLTLAIVSALIVEVGGQSFAVPQTSVIELVRTSEDATNRQRIERLNGAPVLRLRDRLLPLIVLSDVLKLERPDVPEPSELFVVVTQVGSQVFGMIVDQVFDTEEIVVKPMASITRHLSMFSGNTILGDGSVIMILDPAGVAGAIGNAATPSSATKNEVSQQAADIREKNALLIFRAGQGAPKAVPLRRVARLEEFDRKDIESVGGQHVIQYRGKLMPVVPFDLAVMMSAEGRQPALVFGDDERVMALLVDEVVDILETELDVHRSGNTPGIIGSAIIAGRATELIDATYFCEQAFQGWPESSAASSDSTYSLSDGVTLEDARITGGMPGALEIARAA
jgi:two-component system chemotaxis sensor kinase CheA